MKLLADLPTIWHMIFPPARRGSQQERLDAFYRGQAKDYDDFRRRLLHGREELMAGLEIPEGGVWLDMGAGTGSNAELLGDKLGRLRRACLVDLCPSLQDVARNRVRERGWSRVEVVHADAGTWRCEEPADLVTFSYSLTMMPDWFKALDRAWENLKPGGVLGIVEHRNADPDYEPKTPGQAYVGEEYAVRLIESVGFRLVGRSDINHNPKDTKDYMRGVWTLPPNYAMGEQDRARYTAIGESDRFTLKFVKP